MIKQLTGNPQDLCMVLKNCLEEFQLLKGMRQLRYISSYTLAGITGEFKQLNEKSINKMFGTLHTITVVKVHQIL